MDKRQNLIRTLDLPELSQIGIIVHDRQQAVDYYEKVLGFGPFTLSGQDFDLVFDKIEYRGQVVETEFLMAFGPMGSLELELIQPVHGPSVYADFLANKGEGMHHLCFDVDDLDARIERYKDMGINVLMRGWTPISGFAYLDTESIGGVVIELVERPKRRA